MTWCFSDKLQLSESGATRLDSLDIHIRVVEIPVMDGQLASNSVRNWVMELPPVVPNHANIF
jgi:hypothetical protein